jgi:hypothetical protein
MRVVSIYYNMDLDSSKANWNKEFINLEFTWSNGKTTADIITQLDALNDAIYLLKEKYDEIYAMGNKAYDEARND